MVRIMSVMCPVIGNRASCPMSRNEGRHPKDKKTRKRWRRRDAHSVELGEGGSECMPVHNGDMDSGQEEKRWNGGTKAGRQMMGSRSLYLSVSVDG